MTLQMTEAQFQKRITDLCDLLGLKWHHEVDSRKSKSGFPDLVIAGPDAVIFTELKKKGGRLSPEQVDWCARLEAAGAEVYVWWPDDWEFIQSRLLGLAKRRLVTGG